MSEDLLLRTSIKYYNHTASFYYFFLTHPAKYKASSIDYLESLWSNGIAYKRIHRCHQWRRLCIDLTILDLWQAAFSLFRLFSCHPKLKNENFLSSLLITREGRSWCL